MYKKVSKWSIISLVFIYFSTAFAVARTMESADEKKADKQSDNQSEKSKYETILESGLHSEGMFNIIKKDKDYYFEIPINYIGRDMLVVNKLVRVPSELNEAGVNRGVNYQNQMVRLELDKENNRIFIRQIRPLPYSPEKDAINQSVEDNYISPIIAVMPVEAAKADSTTYIVKATDFYDGSESTINNVFSNINLGTSPIGKLSRILSVKAFENNVEAISELTTIVHEGMDHINVTVEVSSSLMLLPEKPMRGRFDNQKVGYFTTDMLAYRDKQQQIEKKSFITRWRLEPKEEDIQKYLAGELVEPKKPIKFYIDNATPVQWRKYIKKGIEDWTVAFEGAGFKNAISAEILTDSLKANMDDVNYSVLTYAASEKMNAMGPSLLDPRTGEILEADIMWWHNVLSMVREWIVVQTGAVCPEARTMNLPEEMMGDAMRFVACHEVGHSLGLRHNMMASWTFPTDSLRSATFTSKMNATASSIMDYARFNYVAQPGDGVKTFSPHIGPYDKFAIEYGYRWYDVKSPEEEKPILADFLEEHNGRLYKYSEAQSSRDAVDPRALTEDLGDNAMESARYGIANLKRIVPNIVEWTTTGEKGQSYKNASDLYYGIICQWNNYLYHALANIGGIYIENTTVGDGVQTFEYVEKERQKDAMKFLCEEVLTYPEWLFGADISKYTFLIRETPVGQKENSPIMMLQNAQAYILWDMLSNNRMMRMTQNELHNGKDAYTPEEMMDDLHEHIFGITEKGGKPDVMQRSIQKNFLDALLTAGAASESVKMKPFRGFANESDCSSLYDDKQFFMLFRKPFCSNYLAEQRYITEKHNFKNQTLSCENFNRQNNLDVQDREAGPRIINLYGSQLRRISDGMSVKRGELLRIRKLLKRRSKTSDRMLKYHYQDMIMRINTALAQ